MRDLALAQIDGLSSRAINCCNDVGIATIGDLFDYIRVRSLKTIKNCGIKTSRELSQLISRYESKVSGYKYNLFAIDYDDDIAAEPVAYTAEYKPQPAVETFTASNEREADSTETLSLLNGLYVSGLNECDAHIADKIKEKYPNVESLLLVVSQQPDGLMTYFEDWSIEDHFRFWTFCKHILHDMITKVEEERFPSLYQSLNEAWSYIDESIKTRKLTLIRSRLSKIAIN